MGKKPYVLYRLEADIADKGIGFSIKSALATFLQHHNLEGKISEFTATSSKFEAILEIYDNGNLDLNISALMSHLYKSGRLPSNHRMKPLVRISPVTPQEYVHLVHAEINKPASDIQWQTAFDKLDKGYEKKLKDSDATIRSLTEALGQRQEVINEKHKKIGHLERKVEMLSSLVTETPDPLVNILQGSIRNDLILEDLLDYSWLKEKNDIGIFLKYASVEEPLRYVQYVNERYDKSFKNEGDLKIWLEEMEKIPSWQDTLMGKKLLKEKERTEKDLALLKHAEESNVSEEVLQAIRGALQNRNIAGLDQSLHDYETAFNHEKDSYRRLQGSKETYDELKNILTRASERRSKHEEAAFLLHISHKDPSLSLYAPLPASEINPSNYFHFNELLKSITGNGYAISSSHYDGEMLAFRIEGESINQEEKYEAYKRLAEMARDAIKSDPLLIALGMHPKVIQLIT